MSNAKHETLADIVADMRELAADIETGNAVVGQTVWRNYADRIEVAWKRESEATTEKSSRVGNAAAMRKALVQVSRIAVEMTRKTITGEPEDRKTVDRWALRLCDIACDAISAPPRNCDVGTAEEQEARFNKFCFSYYNINNVDGECNTCPLNDNVKTTCEFAWMQMPYEEGEAE